LRWLTATPLHCSPAHFGFAASQLAFVTSGGSG